MRDEWNRANLMTNETCLVRTSPELLANSKTSTGIKVRAVETDLSEEAGQIPARGRSVTAPIWFVSHYPVSPYDVDRVEASIPP